MKTEKNPQARNYSLEKYKEIFNLFICFNSGKTFLEKKALQTVV